MPQRDDVIKIESVLDMSWFSRSQVK
jgi:hypothetical protein